MANPDAGVGRRLDALNFFLADVRDGLGPYLAIYLLTVQHWDEASIGIVMSMGGIAALLAQTPAGALIDATMAKRAILVAAAGFVTLGSVALPWTESFVAVAAMKVLTGGAQSVFAPSIAAITLGIVGPKAFARRIGRNEAFNHGGNAMAASVAAATAYFFGPVVVFWLMAAMAVASIAVTLSIPLERSTIMSRAGSKRAPGTIGTSPRASLSSCPPGLCSCSRCAWRSSTSPTRRCCRWSGRSWPWSIGKSAPA